MLWLLSFDDKNTLADAVDKYCIGVPPIQWLAWIPQLLTCLVGSEGKPLLNLISQVRLSPNYSAVGKSHCSNPAFTSINILFLSLSNKKSFKVPLCYRIYVCDCFARQSFIFSYFSLALSSVWTSTSGPSISFSVHAHLPNHDKLTTFMPKWALSCFLFTKLSSRILSLSLLQQFIGIQQSLVNLFLNDLFKKLF